MLKKIEYALKQSRGTKKAQTKLCNNLGFEDAPVWVEEEV